MAEHGYRLADQPQVPDGRWDAPAFVRGDRSVTFAALDARASAFAAAAVQAGLVPGDRVLLLMPNGPETFELLIGCARAGLVAVPVNWRLAPAEARAVARDAQARAVVADPSLSDLLSSVTDGRDLRLCLRLGEEYDRWLSRPRRAVAPVAGDPETVVLQVYTSGTSGRPKGVLITDRNLDAKVPQVTPLWGLTADSMSLLATPLFHVGALSWGLTGLYAGATTVLAGDASPATLLRHLVEDRISHTFLVPAMITRLCEAAESDATFPDLRAIVYGAAPITPEAQSAALHTFGPVLHHVYGMSETTGAFTEMPADPDLPADSPLLRSAGRPYPWVELEIRDPETGASVPTGEYGEVWTRSAQNTPGYFRLPEETRTLLTDDGWLRTGDGGRLDAEGRLFLTDRVKDMVITGGENVYPEEVEEVLRRHPGVAEVAVFGVADARWGEAVAAAVVPRPDCVPTPEELVAFTDGLLAGYKRPRTVVVVDALPRNPTGKILRRRLQEQYR
ncbi:fatty acid--CoA ligase [Plantactinospora mayteni]|uniref:Acyl-CoA synthetase n=1 Tax=Plantactinospora mayteni TaxID=566021 RepID=A0ABQ4EY32_9ACTN|nr:AMP-binding protein [Plantactinospora mayteni]GIG99563.1 acyl-CoA synthetase [Plantactinospora mayteni]